MDEAVLEIATDKVDAKYHQKLGTLVEILFNTDDVVQVGQTIAIETEGGAEVATTEVKAETQLLLLKLQKQLKLQRNCSSS